MPKKVLNIGPCALCDREMPLTFHHLIPKVVSKNKWFKKNFEKVEFSQGIDLCRTCHSFIHKKFTEKQLGRDFNTLEKLKANELVQRFALWAAKQK